MKTPELAAYTKELFGKIISITVESKCLSSAAIGPKVNILKKKLGTGLMS